jgi:hypothetical protein
MNTSGLCIAPPGLAAPQAGADTGEAPRREIATVPVSSVRHGNSPRLAGYKAHIARLAEAETGPDEAKVLSGQPPVYGLVGFTLPTSSACRGFE